MTKPPTLILRYNAHTTAPPPRVVLRRSGGGSAEVMLDVATAQGILSSSPDPTMRQHVWEVLNTGSAFNIDVLDRLIEARRKLAVQLGYKSHAEMATIDKVLDWFVLVFVFGIGIVYGHVQFSFLNV